MKYVVLFAWIKRGAVGEALRGHPRLERGREAGEGERLGKHIAARAVEHRLRLCCVGGRRTRAAAAAAASAAAAARDGEKGDEHRAHIVGRDGLARGVGAELKDSGARVVEREGRDARVAEVCARCARAAPRAADTCVQEAEDVRGLGVARRVGGEANLRAHARNAADEVVDAEPALRRRLQSAQLAKEHRGVGAAETDHFSDAPPRRQRCGPMRRSRRRGGCAGRRTVRPGCGEARQRGHCGALSIHVAHVLAQMRDAAQPNVRDDPLELRGKGRVREGVVDVNEVAPREAQGLDALARANARLALHERRDPILPNVIRRRDRARELAEHVHLAAKDEKHTVVVLTLTQHHFPRREHMRRAKVVQLR